MPGVHAKLSPSAAHRWMNCPGSVRLIGDESSTSTQAAMKGTAAHKLLETMIIADHHDVREYAGATILVPGDDVEQKPDGGYWDAELYLPGVAALDPDKPRPGWVMFVVDEKMVEGVQVTIDEVDRLRSEMWNVKVYPERYIDMSWLDPRFGGTADVTLVEGEGDDDFLGVQTDDFEGWVHLVDHKNGWILVDHNDNEQLLNYGVGLLHEHPKAKGVRITISQPNAAHVEGPTRTAEYTRAEIEAFAKRMKKAALETDKPNAPLRAGEWCTFCAAKTRCDEFDASVLAEAKGEFADDDEPPPGLETLPVPNSATELAQKARWVTLINGWAKEVMASIQRELEAGVEVPGWKLVQGRANRIWSAGYTPQSIAEAFVELGVPEEELWTKPELRSPAQIEKLGPKGRTKAIQAVRKTIKAKVAELAFKPDGKITVAEDADPREAVGAFHDAREEFSDDEEDFGT